MYLRDNLVNWQFLKHFVIFVRVKGLGMNTTYN